MRVRIAGVHGYPSVYNSLPGRVAESRLPTRSPSSLHHYCDTLGREAGGSLRPLRHFQLEKYACSGEFLPAASDSLLVQQVCLQSPVILVCFVSAEQAVQCGDIGGQVTTHGTF